MNIGIVTSCYNYYDRFLGQWLTSIFNLKTKPTTVTIVISGKDFDQNNIFEQEIRLQNSGIHYQIIYLAEHQGMGFARNEAVRNTNTKWIMYLDIDDVILNDAIDTYQRYENETDVICGGFRMMNGQRRNFLFTDASNEKALAGGYVSCSHSVYRKSLWEQRPYITKNDYIEQTLWLGFAQIGARFKGTDKICTVYLSRPDGHNRTMTAEQKAEAKAQREDFLTNGVRYD